MAHKFHPQNLDRLENPKRRDVFDPQAVLRDVVFPPAPCLLDLGVGTGFYLDALVARAGSEGTVFALDTQPAALERVARKILENGWSQVRPLPCEEVTLPLPDGSIDFCMLVFLYHEFVDPPANLAELRRVLRPAGQLLVVDWKKCEREMGPPPEEVLDLPVMEGQMNAAGFTVDRVVEPSPLCWGIFLTHGAGNR